MRPHHCVALSIIVGLLLLVSAGIRPSVGQPPPISETTIALGYFSPVLIGDADNDGVNEVVAGDWSTNSVKFYVFNGSTYVFERELYFAEDPIALAVGDTDGDGRTELVVGTENADAGGYVYVGEVIGSTFSQEWKSGLIQTLRVSNGVSLGDGDGDGRTEIAVAVGHYGRRLDVYEWNGGGYSLAWRDAIGSDVDSAHFADTDGDGIDELIAGTGCYSDYGVRVYDASMLSFSASGLGRTIATGGDVDGDGVAEVIAVPSCYCGGATSPPPILKIYDHTGSGYSLSYTSPVLSSSCARAVLHTGELAGGGAEEIAYGMNPPSNSIGVYHWNGSTWESLWSHTLDIYPLTVWIGDADNDGVNELSATSPEWLKVFDGWDLPFPTPTSTPTPGPPTPTPTQTPTPTPTPTPGPPPVVGTFEPNGGSGVVGEWVDLTTTYSDPDGYEDIGLAVFLMSRRLNLEYAGMIAAYHQPSNVLWLRDGGFCVPGQAQLRTTDYITLDCGNTSVQGAGETMTITWRVWPEQCFIGGCGLNMAYGFVMDSTQQWDAGLMGIWTLDAMRGAVGRVERAARQLQAEELPEILEQLWRKSANWPPRRGTRHAPPH